MTKITKAIKTLQNGGVVAFPTETVYGLGADAKNADAIDKIFALKERPLNHPLIVHIADMSELKEWAENPSQEALRLAEAFWPGPLTLILKKRSNVLNLLTGGQNTIGLRIPRHPIAQALLRGFGSGVAAPSANKFTHVSPTDAASVYAEFGEKVECILDGGDCAVGLESTIIDMSTVESHILRPGMISVKDIGEVLGHPLVQENKPQTRVPGMHLLHYAPRTKTTLIRPERLASFIQSLEQEDLPVALITHSNFDLLLNECAKRINLSQDPKVYAHDLYRTLRSLDNGKYKRIMIEDPPVSPEWDAIRDRLTKASTK